MDIKVKRNFQKNLVSQVKENLILTKKRRCNPTNIAITQLITYKEHYMYKAILCISDLHIPYHHPQAFDFLKALKKKLNPDLIVNGGDELDKHALSFHDSDPDLPSAGD